jgi:phosphate acetyltransferase
MGAVVSRQSGIRTARRISHCFIMDVPRHPDALIITDAAVNIAPTLDDKVDIVQNAIDLAHAMGVAEVRVALLSALETVTAKVPSTIEAAALCKMADRGQITGALLDGPLALDNAISAQAAAIKQINSPVAGRAKRMCSWCQTSRRATCWRRACRFWLAPTPRASCWARASPSF